MKSYLISLVCVYVFIYLYVCVCGWGDTDRQVEHVAGDDGVVCNW